MTFADDLPLVLVVLFLAALNRSALGFGDALIAMPLLSLLLDDTKTAAAVVALVSTATSVAILSRDWRHVLWRTTLLLVVPAFVGIHFGVELLVNVDKRFMEAALGVVLLAFVAFRTLRKRPLELNSDASAPAFGLVAGLLGGAYNTHGPPLVIFGILRGWSPAQFRATLQGYFLPAALFVLAEHALNGLWTPPVLGYSCAAIPVVLAAVLLGRMLHGRLAHRGFANLVYAMLVVIAATLLVHAAWGEPPAGDAAAGEQNVSFLPPVAGVIAEPAQQTL